MNIDDPVVRAILQRSMVSRIATLSRNGRPSINPLYFVSLNDQIWLSTDDWTLAARNVKADPRVSILFEVEREPRDRRVLRISGAASLRTDPEALRPFNVRVALKYLLTPGGIRNNLRHIWQHRFVRNYHAQNAKKGRPCVIVVIPERVEFLTAEQFG
jgi:Pyridoxamine 5'-phosphate oxidase